MPTVTSKDDAEVIAPSLSLPVKVPLKALTRNDTSGTSFNLFFAMRSRNTEDEESPVSNIVRASYLPYGIRPGALLVKAKRRTVQAATLVG